VCDAEVELQSVRGTRRLPLSDFLTGPRKTARAADELLTAVLLPKSSLAGNSHFLKLGARSYLVISIAMTAARLVIEDDRIKEIALAVGACGPVATRLTEIEQALVGHPLDVALITDGAVAAALSPIDDVRADAAYRAQSAAELLRRTVEALISPARQAA
jgi:CO/xanthine dehydrogenase FAD-binding subunit